MNGSRIKKVVSALGLALLISVPSTAYAMKGDYTVDDIGEGADYIIKPPQYADESKIPSVDEWKKSVELQGKGGDTDAILIRDNQNKVKIKKTEKDGLTPIKGVDFKIYETRENAKKGTKSVGDAKSGEDGLLSFTKDVPYYGFYIREESVSDPYLLRKDAIVPFYKDNGVRFLGEIVPGDMKVTSINQDGEEKNLDSSKNINQELQSLVDGGTPFNENTNWLVFNDNGTEKLVSKKPLKHSIAWNSLYNAGVVFDKKESDDLINADFTHSNYSKTPSLKDKDLGKDKEKSYESTYVTVNNKKYIVRLMRAYNEKAKINDNKSWGSWDSNTTKSYVKGSEWNRLLLPLIKDGRYGSNTEGFVEDNMPTLANYSWWTDFGGNTNLSNNMNNTYYGVLRWTQETGYDGILYRANRGYYSSGSAAAYANSDFPSYADDYRGWLAVLERVDN